MNIQVDKRNNIDFSRAIPQSQMYGTPHEDLKMIEMPRLDYKPHGDSNQFNIVKLNEVDRSTSEADKLQQEITKLQKTVKVQDNLIKQLANKKGYKIK